MNSMYAGGLRSDCFRPDQNSELVGNGSEVEVEVESGCADHDPECFDVDEIIIVDSFSSSDTSSSYELLQSLCCGYGSCVNFEAVKDVYKDDFFQQHAKGSGYQFTENFLSIINKYKTEFISEVDVILSGLDSVLGDKTIDTTIPCFMDKACSYFCNAFYQLRPRCVDVLQSRIIPTIVKSIFRYNIVCSSDDRRMTYPEMEKFFLHCVTSLERLIILRAINRWDDLCAANSHALSLVSDTDYTNPFHHFHYDDSAGTILVNRPAAFLYKFGAYISFIASAKIDTVVSYFISKYSVKLKKIVYSECYRISLHSSDPSCYIKEFKKELRVFILKTFKNIVIEEKVVDTLNSFLGEIITWDDVAAELVKKDKFVVFNEVIMHSYKLLEGTIYKCVCDIVDHFQKVLSLYRRFQLNVHPDDFLCDKYGYIINIDIAEIYKDKFFQLYAGRKGYQLTEDFLLIINKYKKKLINRADTIFSSLSDFFVGIVVRSTVVCFMNRMCSSFCESAYNLIPRCINVLKSYIIPPVVKSILYANVIDGGSVRGMTYNEKEQFFLHYVTSLERLIMLRAINHWSNFCHSNGHVLSLVADIDYSNPFQHFHCDDKVGVNLSSHPSAFVYNFGAYISFVAFYKVDEIVSNFVKKHSALLKNSFYRKCFHVSKNNSGGKDCRDDFEKLIRELRYFIPKEFRSKLTDGGVVDVLSDFLSKSLVWSEHDGGAEVVEIDHLPVIVDEIIDYMYKSLEYSVYDDMCGIAIHFQCISTLSSLYLSPVTIYKLGLIVDKLDLNVHPDDCSRVLFIREKASLRIVNHLTNVFSYMLKANTVLPNGEVLTKDSWSSASGDLYTIAMKSLNSIFKDESMELHKALSKAHVVEVTKGNVSSCIVRKISDDEKSSTIKRAKYRGRELKLSIKKAWLCAIGNLDSENNEEGNTPADIVVYEPDRRWGVNFGYRDSFAISNAREKFLSKARIVVYNKFSEMLKGKHKLYDNELIDRSSLDAILEELSIIVKAEIHRFINSGNEIEEISEIMSKSRVVVDYVVDRELINEEKSVILEKFIEFPDDELKYLFRKVKEDSCFSLDDSNLGVGSGPTLLPESSSIDFINDECRNSLDSIRLEFIDKFRPIVGKVIGTLLLDYVSPYNLDDLLNKMNLSVAKAGYDFFKEGGFFDSAEVLLADYVGVGSVGSLINVTNERRKLVLKSFMDAVANSINCLVSECAASLISEFVTFDESQLERTEVVSNVSSVSNVSNENTGRKRSSKRKHLNSPSFS
ncbi:hypothetical protein [Candidatus Ichthyocystis hellenicum]|uniref:hypothetical protein n=1 Tax=Candidatus Ichthyocystis hellenicum TaxID=1561003 RepID=UPI000B89E16B|nr:hypothetical protein [Candidatus Ichthyocystis hellenicum]